MLEQDIGDIRENLRRGRYPNEAAVSQGIVRRLLETLGWPIYDPQVVYPEFTVKRLHVDYALCHPASKPRIFIEVKGVGKSDNAERQLFEYAFHMGVPLAILTDGREWSFFLPAGAGSYDERQVYKLNLVEHDVAESVRRLERYLRYEAVCSEEAFIAAQEDYRDIAREREIREVLPKAWAKLVAEENEYLIDAVAECVDDLCGHRPAPDIVARFLREMVHRSSARPPNASAQRPTPSDSPLVSERTGPTDVAPPQPPTSPSTSSTDMPADVGFTLFGEFVSCQSGKEILVGVFEALAERESKFNEGFVAQRHGTKRRWLAEDPNELHPGNPRRAQHGSYSHQLKSGYWLLLQVGQKQRNEIIKRACDVARIGYDTDLQINDPPIRSRPGGRGPSETGA